MTDYNLIDDLHLFTQIPLNILKKLVDIATKNIAQIIVLSDNSYGQIHTIDIGIGNLNYQIIDEDLIFSFEPSSTMVKYITNKELAVVDSVENRLKNKIISTYKELM